MTYSLERRGGTCDMMPRAKLTKTRALRSALFPPGNLSCFLFHQDFSLSGLFIFSCCFVLEKKKKFVIPLWCHLAACHDDVTSSLSLSRFNAKKLLRAPTRHPPAQPTPAERWQQPAEREVSDIC
jgi:hypothetical protein